ncbi:hypothetical protein ACH49M_21420 [Rhodococcus qingshengii]
MTSLVKFRYHFTFTATAFGITAAGLAFAGFLTLTALSDVLERHPGTRNS